MYTDIAIVEGNLTIVIKIKNIPILYIKSYKMLINLPGNGVWEDRGVGGRSYKGPWETFGGDGYVSVII